MKNITLSAEAELIENARRRAAREKRTLNAAFREWLQSYASPQGGRSQYEELMKQLSHVRMGAAYTRDEMNER